jgi:hypothetical protein
MVEKFDEGKIEKKVQDIEYSSDGGLITYREIYEDGSLGNWETTNIETSNGPGLMKLRKDLKDKYGGSVEMWKHTM